MGKISPVSIKYIIHANLELSGIADRPDIIGAVFGQTEGLLGEDLELRELQKSGRIGRIDVKTETMSGKTKGEILLPSSMGKSETAIIAAALETIEKVGPCDAKLIITVIEDVRVSKRKFILERAKKLLQMLVESLPDSQALTNQITTELREHEIVEYGKDRLAAGPDVDNEEEIIVVEGRADVVNLLRYGIKNVIAMNGATPTNTILELSQKKTIVLFLDGDRGGDLILRNLLASADIDFVARAPDGKEVEELTSKEILKALRLRITAEQVKKDMERNGNKDASRNYEKPTREWQTPQPKIQQQPTPVVVQKPMVSKPVSAVPQKRNNVLLKSMFDELVGTRGAFVLDEKLNILGKVPVKELDAALRNISEGIHTIVMDGAADLSLIKLAETKNIQYIVATQVNGKSRTVQLLTQSNLK